MTSSAGLDRIAERDAHRVALGQEHRRACGWARSGPGGIASRVPVTRIGTIGMLWRAASTAAPRRTRGAAAVARPGSLGIHEQVPAPVQQLVEVARGALVEAAAAPVHRHGVEQQRHQRCDDAVAVEVVGRGGDRGALADPAGKRREDHRRVDVAAVVGDQDHGAARARQACRGRLRGGGRRSPSSVDRNPRRNASRMPRAAQERAHGTSSWDAALRSRSGSPCAAACRLPCEFEAPAL